MKNGSKHNSYFHTMMKVTIKHHKQKVVHSQSQAVKVNPNPKQKVEVEVKVKVKAVNPEIGIVQIVICPISHHVINAENVTPTNHRLMIMILSMIT